MTIKWNRESLLVILMGIMIVFGIFYYGRLYLIDPAKEEADVLSDTVESQRTLVENYPPSEELMNDYQTLYEETANYLPVGVQMNEELVRLEQLAEQANVTLQSVTRLTDRETVEGLADNFYKNTYSAELSGESPNDFRQLIQLLANEERVWDMTLFSYSKSGDENYTASVQFALYYYLNTEVK